MCASNVKQNHCTTSVNMCFTASIMADYKEVYDQIYYTFQDEARMLIRRLITRFEDDSLAIFLEPYCCIGRRKIGSL